MPRHPRNGVPQNSISSPLGSVASLALPVDADSCALRLDDVITNVGHYCMCGKVDTVKWKKLNDTRCSTPCTGDKREKCGGEPAPGGTGDAVSAYEIACTGGDPSPQLTVSETASDIDDASTSFLINSRSTDGGTLDIP